MSRPLAEIVSNRLKAAGFDYDDPALVAIRAANRAAAERGMYRVELRRGQFGQTRLIQNKRQDDGDC